MPAVHPLSAPRPRSPYGQLQCLSLTYGRACCWANPPPPRSLVITNKLEVTPAMEKVSVIKDVCTAKFKGCSAGRPAYWSVGLGSAGESNANLDQSGFFVH